MTLERFDRLVDAQLAHVDLLIGTAAGERGVGLPVDVQRRRRMKRKLLRTIAGRCVPDDGGAIDAGRQNVVAAFVPFERENRALVLAERCAQSSLGGPDTRVAVVAAGCQQSAVALCVWEL